MGKKIIAAGNVGRLLFCGGEDQTSLNGNVFSPAKWERHFREAKWERRFREAAESREVMIYGIPRKEVSHTHTEARQLILHAAASAIKSLYVTTITPHQIRGFVEVVWAIRTGCGGLIQPPAIRAYSKPVVGVRSWQYPTKIAQTQPEEKPMIDTIGDELDRIERYFAKGDLVSCEEVLDYLRWRDTE